MPFKNYNTFVVFAIIAVLAVLDVFGVLAKAIFTIIAILPIIDVLIKIILIGEYNLKFGMTLFIAQYDAVIAFINALNVKPAIKTGIKAYNDASLAIIKAQTEANDRAKTEATTKSREAANSTCAAIKDRANSLRAKFAERVQITNNNPFTDVFNTTEFKPVVDDRFVEICSVAEAAAKGCDVNNMKRVAEYTAAVEKSLVRKINESDQKTTGVWHNPAYKNT